jgi:4,5-dihydroxyphthalate decarboxylase
VLRQAGVDLAGIRWLVGSIDGEFSGRYQGDLPPYVALNERDVPLRDLLLAGELDALICPSHPKGFGLGNSAEYPIVRLVRDFRQAEREYYRRTGIYPGIHIVGVRRDLFEREPWIVRSLYRALDESRLRGQESRRILAETTPWLRAEIEETTALMGRDWSPNGVEPNRTMIAALCEEEYLQGFIAERLDPTTVFSEFEAIMSSG